MLANYRSSFNSLLLRAWAQPAVLASAFTTASASAAPQQQQQHASPESDGGPASSSQPGLQSLKTRLADGPGLDAFVGGDEEATSSPYSVYAPGFKAGFLRLASLPACHYHKLPARQRHLLTHSIFLSSLLCAPWSGLSPQCHRKTEV